MRLPRFFIAPDAIHDKRAILSGAIAHQIRNVLRLGAGERVILLDNSGHEFEVELASVSGEVLGRVVEKRLSAHEPRVKLTLYQALLKADKFEWVLQKGTELGIAAFTPIVSARVVRTEVSAGKHERWQRIVREAAEQSERGIIPHLSAPIPFERAVQAIMGQGLSMIPYEEEHTCSLRAALQANLSALADSTGLTINLFIGPEGGFTPQEIVFAREHQITAITLGPRILRTETAGLVTASAILYELGEME